jgi:hypothetical protein
LAEAGAAPARPDYSTGLSGRLGPRLTATRLVSWEPAGLPVSGSEPDWQARSEVCGARPHENAVVERRKARVPVARGTGIRLASVFRAVRTGPWDLASPCAFRRSAPLAGGRAKRKTLRKSRAHARRGNEKSRSRTRTGAHRRRTSWVGSASAIATIRTSNALASARASRKAASSGPGANV